MKMRLHHWILLALITVGLLAMTGCGSHETPPMEGPALRAQITGKVWELQEMFSREVSAEKPLTIEFLDNGQVRGFAGCNDFTGPYTLDGDDLKLGPLASTRKACGAALGEQEYSYLFFLSKISSVRVDDGELHLLSKDFPRSMHYTFGDQGFW